ncbi:MAG: hypothetical protein NVSMB31_08060 [Vulcanimicrobiaceae bacterium]
MNGGIFAMKLQSALLFGLLSAGCSHHAAGPDPALAAQPHVVVLMAKNGGLLVNGKPGSVLAAKRQIAALRQKHGAIWYAREDAHSAPTPVQVATFQQLDAVVSKAHLPIMLFEDTAFTTLITLP